MAIFALVLAVVALGTTTYAWFTVGQAVSTESIELNVKSEEGLEFRYVGDAGNSEWSQFLDETTFLQRLAADYGQTMSQFRFDAVTSQEGQTFKKLVVGSITSLSAPIADLQTTDSGVLEFKLEFRTKKQSANLKWSSVTLNSTEAIQWAPGLTFTHNKSTYGSSGTVTPSNTEAYYPHDAARISVGKIVDTTESNTIVYEAPNSASNSVLGDGTDLNTGKPGTFAKGAHDYFQKMTGKSVQAAWDAIDTSSITTRVAPTVTSINGSQFSVAFGTTPSAGYYTVMVIIRVYLEGFDYDALNAILNGKINVALEFALAE